MIKSYNMPLEYLKTHKKIRYCPGCGREIMNPRKMSMHIKRHIKRKHSIPKPTRFKLFHDRIVQFVQTYKYTVLGTALIAVCAMAVFIMNPIDKKQFVCADNQLERKIKNSTVHITTDGNNGTGFFIDNGTYVITNNHIVEFNSNVTITMPDGVEVGGVVIGSDPSADIALIKPYMKGYNALSFPHFSTLSIGDDVLVVGYILTNQNILNESIRTQVLNRKMNARGVEYFQVKGKEASANDGGPVVNLCGDVVGLATDLEKESGFSYVISHASLRKSIEYMKTSGSTIEALGTLPMFEDITTFEKTIETYYQYLKVKNFTRAYEMLVFPENKDVSFDTWMKREKNTVFLVVNNIRSDALDPAIKVATIKEVAYDSLKFSIQEKEVRWTSTYAMGKRKLIQGKSDILSEEIITESNPQAFIKTLAQFYPGLISIGTQNLQTDSELSPWKQLVNSEASMNMLLEKVLAGKRLYRKDLQDIHVIALALQSIFVTNELQ